MFLGLFRYEKTQQLQQRHGFLVMLFSMKNKVGDCSE